MSTMIEFIDGPNPPQATAFEVADGVLIRIGRKIRCEVAVTDPSVSGEHFSLRRTDDGGLQLHDLNSRNGTYVNGKRVSEIQLAHDDEIRIGKSRFRVLILRQANCQNDVPSNPSDQASEPQTHFSVSLWGDSLSAQDDESFSDADRSNAFDLSPPEIKPALRAVVPTEQLLEEQDTDETMFDDAADARPTNQSVDSGTANPVGSKFAGAQGEPAKGQIRCAILTFCTPDGEQDEIRIRAGQSVVVGSSGGADVTLRNAGLEARHFKVICQRDSVTAESFNKKRALSINGTALVNAELATGDQLVAGNISFAVDIDGAVGREVQATPLIVAAAVGVGAAAAVVEAEVARPGENIELEAVDESADTITGVVSFKGSSKDLSIEKLLLRMAKRSSISMLLDPVRLGTPGDTRLNQHLLARDDTGAVKTSWLEIADKKMLPPWLEKMWGTDSGVILASSVAPAEMLEALGDLQAKESSLLDVCWPSMLATMLTSYEKETVVEFFRVVDFVVMESGPRHWVIYCLADKAAKLDVFRLVCPMIEEPANA